MWGLAHQRFFAGRTLDVRLGPLRIELRLPARKRAPRGRNPGAVSRALHFWLAVLAAAVCADLAKIGFVLVWAEANQMLMPPAWLPDGLRITMLMGLYLFGIAGMFYFAAVAWRGPAKAERILEPYAPNDGPKEDPPGEPRRCGVPIRPRPPGPLAARCAAPKAETLHEKRRKALRRASSRNQRRQRAALAYC